jgi:2-polyprenyl-3-methyl-5-hydroxy-6-metoxy-1,4-benzoquinol methylase
MSSLQASSISTTDSARQSAEVSPGARRVEASTTGGRTLEIFGRTPKVNAWIYSKFADHVRGDVLEIGSGIGNLSRLIVKDAESVVLIDVEDQYIACRDEAFGREQRVVVTRFNLDEPTPEEIAHRRFDAIVAVNVIERLQEDQRAVGMLASLLKPGGRFLIYVPAVPLAYGTLDRMLGHYRRYTARSLAGLLRGAGLEPGPGLLG